LRRARSDFSDLPLIVVEIAAPYAHGGGFLDASAIATPAAVIMPHAVRLTDTGGDSLSCVSRLGLGCRSCLRSQHRESRQVVSINVCYCNGDGGGSSGGSGILQ
jgi:hypothetical protein